MFNTSPILIRFLPPRNQQAAPVVVGPRAIVTSSDSQSLPFDPWANWTGPKVQPLASSRTVEGPLETRLAAQDEKIAALQQSLDKVTKTQDAMAIDATKRFEKIEQTQESSMQLMTQTIDTLRTDLDGSLKQVMQQSTQLFDARLTELKQLLTRQPKRDLEPDEADMRDWLSPQQGKGLTSVIQHGGTVGRASFCFALEPPILFSIVYSIVFGSLALRSMCFATSRFCAVIHFMLLIADGFFYFVSCGLCFHSGNREVCVRSHEGISDPLLRHHDTFLNWFCHFLSPISSHLPFKHLWFCLVFVFVAQQHADRQFCYLHASRVGEALHPGPPPPFCTVAITNPTSIVSKPSTYHELITEHSIDIVTAAETAATKLGQKIFAGNVRQWGYRTVWSPPVPEKFARSDGMPSLRGQATGVAAFTHFNIRTVTGTLPEAQVATSRMLHTVVDCHGFQMQLLIMYGPAAAGTNAIARQMFADACTAVSNLPLPYLILGDFNCNPWKVGISEDLQAMGLVDLPQLFPTLHGTQMPPTCRQVTRPDNALVSPQLQPYLRNIRVLPDPYFDCHQVVLLQFDLQIAAQQQLRLHLPAPWYDLPISYEHFDEGYHHATQQLGPPETIEQWGVTIECAVDFAFRTTQVHNDKVPWSQTQPIPKRFRGRCQPRKPVMQGPVLFTKPGRPGDYHPGEVCRRRTRDLIKQVRRIQCLHNRLQKFQGALMSPEQFQVAFYEWHAILRSRCMQTHFASWCQAMPELGPPTLGLPTVEYLHDLLQLVRHKATDAQAFDLKIIKRMRVFHHHLDAKWAGHSSSYATMRDGFIAPFERIQTEETRHAHVVPDDQGNLQVWCDNPNAFQSTQMLQVDLLFGNRKVVHLTMPCASRNCLIAFPVTCLLQLCSSMILNCGSRQSDLWRVSLPGELMEFLLGSSSDCRSRPSEISNISFLISPMDFQTGWWLPLLSQCRKLQTPLQQHNYGPSPWWRSSIDFGAG